MCPKITLKKTKNAEIVFISISYRNAIIQPALMYSMAKHFCDQKYGIISQCFKSDYFKKTPTGFLLKVNVKLGGLSTIVSTDNFETLSFRSTRIMVVGTGVNHPGETDRVSFSIGAVVDSLDLIFTTYIVSIRAQKKDREVVVTSRDVMIVELLEEFSLEKSISSRKSVCVPKCVSDGEFDIIRSARNDI